MSIHYYAVGHCDNCSAQSEPAEGETGAKKQLEKQGWAEVNGEFLCPQCVAGCLADATWRLQHGWDVP